MSDLEEIQQRNKRVELDKAWELSWSRRFFIMCTTYIIACVWLLLIQENSAWLKAFVPTIGYLLSTLSLPFLKKWWISKQ